MIEYAVREENVPAGYDVYYTENDIENVQQGGLRLTKRVTGAGGDREKEFVFTVILDNTDISGVYGDMLFADGAAEVTLRHGESALAEGLPAGTAYTVTEKGAEADGYTVTSQGAEGEISPGEISEVSFENHKDAVPEDGENVQTGDAGTPGIFVASFVVAVTAALTAVSRRRRRRNR